MVIKKLVLAFEKMIYIVHVSQAILNSRAIGFLVPLHFLKLFVHEGSQQEFYDI